MVEQIPIPQQKPSAGQEIANLFTQKGELITQIEIAQANLQAVNQRLGAILKPNPPSNPA